MGAGWVSDDSFKFGKYNGLERQGGYGVLNFDVGERGAWDSDDAGYWRWTGSGLGLDTRETRFERGVQGRWRVSVGYDQLPTRRSDSAQTIFVNPGSDTLTLPSGWVAGQNTATMAQLIGSLRDVDIKHVRRRLDLGFERTLREEWQFGTTYRHETKDGNKTIGGVIGNSGGNPRAVLLPEPVDYSTDQIDAVLRWGDKRRQFQAGYYVSLFHNDTDALTWQNPYAAITGWNAAAGYPNGQGSLALPPDNQFHQLSVAGGWNFSERTRLSGDAAIGRMLQNERFLPYTINPTLAASITQPLPRDSLDGRIDTTVVNVRLASRPTARWFWNAGFRYDDRDNQTPREEYVYIGGDSQTQQTEATSSRRRFNEPYSYREEKLRFDTGYKLADRLDLNASAEHRRTERTYSEREEADENTYSIGARSDFSDRYEKLASDQDGQSIRGATRVTDAVNPARSWFADHRDRVSTWGTGLTHEVIENRLEVGADYVRSRSTSDVVVSAGTALAFSALPQDTTKLQSLGLYARYKWRKDIAVNLGYRFEDYESSDWAIDGIEANQLANVILLGEDSPDYRVNVVSLGFTFTF